MISIIIFLSILIVLLMLHIYQTKMKLKNIAAILDDISAGNLDRRLLADADTETSSLVFKINEIVIKDKNRLAEVHKAEQAYKKLVTSLSHDIRTPLASLVGYLEVLEKESMTPEEQQQFLQVAKNKAIHLSDYIQSLFEWLKLESGEWAYDFKEQDICELTRLILADWVIKLEKNNMEFQFDIPQEAIYMTTDQNAYSRIVHNLLDNMMKHSHASLLSVKLNRSFQDLTLTLADNGIGIPEKDLPFVFDRLYKCDTSRSENSNGLGLAIAKELTAALHGEIFAESLTGQGTTFQLRFKIP